MTDVWHALKHLLWLSQKHCNSTDMSLNRACLHTPLVYSYKCQTPKPVVLPYSGKIWRTLNLAKWRKKVVI